MAVSSATLIKGKAISHMMIVFPYCVHSEIRGLDACFGCSDRDEPWLVEGYCPLCIYLHAFLALKGETTMGNTVSSEQKLDYLKGIFDSVQDDEKMMQEYSCALLRQIHIYGSMYITNKRIYFLSNIVGFKTEVAISLSNVTKITRQYSVGLIPNSIEVVTEDEEKVDDFSEHIPMAMQCSDVSEMQLTLMNFSMKIFDCPIGSFPSDVKSIPTKLPRLYELDNLVIEEFSLHLRHVPLDQSH
ncbi:hypothetical protein BSL78_10660 [Apostichopus japonicus]|uniref:GRAM domain-containing protein n=1 Tax=Stichopus japonicus TaxID=307972 RepID=A0A2G8KWR3_STIJA|nr:hypothetical protein BSL78_10660 [Apostichopus japonicus]